MAFERIKARPDYQGPLRPARDGCHRANVTAVPASPRVSELRDLFRYLSDFHATYEACGLEEITTPYGNTWSLWDLDYLLKVAQERLTRRQLQAIELCLIHGIREADAAEMMGVSRSNPVMMYATLGLHRLIEMIDFGEIERFNRPNLRPRDAQERHHEHLGLLAKDIRSKVFEINSCLLFPNRLPREPRIMVRSAASPTGYTSVSPMDVLWVVEIGPIPPGCRIQHSSVVPRVSLACVNPQHGELLQSADRKARIDEMAAAYTAAAQRRERERQARIQELAAEYIRSRQQGAAA